MSRVFHGCRALMAAAKSGAGRAAKSGAGRAAKSGASRAAKPAVTSAAAKSTATSAAAAEKANIGIMKALPVSPALKEFVGAPEVSRAEAIKKIWDHIKSNQLQNPANKREIRCDEKLKSIFSGRDKVGMLEIAGLLSPHFKV